MQNSYLTTKTDPDLTKLSKQNEPKWLDPASAIYTNRNLNLRDIELIGFDMDYTLAKYFREPMEMLQYQLTVEYLIKNKNYPSAIREMPYDPNLIIRGLVLDKRSGILIKLDTHDKVWRAIYGKRLLSKKEIEAFYANQKISLNFPYFASLDTLFAMPEACLYCNLIDFFELQQKKGKSTTPVKPKHNSKILNKKIDTNKLFDDVRNSIDAIHSDDSLKGIITKNISTYVDDSPDIALTLHKLRSANKKIFLLTNSYWEYTNSVLTYILNNKLPEYNDWKSYFDIIIVGAGKPGFFTGKKPFLVLQPSNKKKNKQNEEFIELKSNKFEHGKIYQGGNLIDFEKMAKCSGEQILYIGDHIYGDIVLSKKKSLWRTCLVVEELKPELEMSLKYSKLLSKSSKLEAQCLDIDSEIGHRRAQMAHVEAAITEIKRNGLDKKSLKKMNLTAQTLRKEVESLKRQLAVLDDKSFTYQDRLEKQFHTIWGRLFREHNQLSRFGAQITYYACIYTSDLTNLLQYSPKHIFRAPGDLMSHDIALINNMHLPKTSLNEKK